MPLPAATPLDPSPHWHSQSPEAVLTALGSDRKLGLDSVTVRQRQATVGPNQLPQVPPKPAWLRFLLQFHDPLLYILLVAGVIKALLNSWVNAGVIWGVTLINAVIGYLQESKAENAIAALAATVETEAMVIRDGELRKCPSRELVPGDVVQLVSGDKVPADLRLLDCKSLQINESALTGESLPVEKSPDPVAVDCPLADRRNSAYAGSYVTFGTGVGVVVAIGTATETGRISQLIESRPNLSTPLTRKFQALSQVLLYVILTVAALTFVIGLAYGSPWQTMFEPAIALAVSAIPEGLPAVVTITLAIGVSRMARRNAIVRKLPAVEALGSATVICSDKTGTLTENQMTVQAIAVGDRTYTLTGEGYAPQGELLWQNQLLQLGEHPLLAHCLQIGLLCNDSALQQRDGFWSVIGDPTEGALLAAASKAGLDQQALEQAFPRLDELPFESEFQYMATLHPGDESTVIYVKGALEALLQRCQEQFTLNGSEPLQPDYWHQQAEQLASQGLRVLAFAQKTVSADQQRIDHSDLDRGLVFVGLQAMIDPPRPEAIAAVQACQQAGIRVKMITGDHLATARAIAERLGLGPSSTAIVGYSGRELEAMGREQLRQAVTQGSVFARVAPEQKLRIVEALQANGDSVAMTGDGVNDAPALQQADIGIAMGQAGTEVAKEAADIVLTDDNFASIRAAVEEGRTVYRNLVKAIAFILPVNGGESMTILLSVLLNRADLPILSLQVLWLNMVNSIAMTVPLAFEPRTANVMQVPPRDPQQSLLSLALLKRIGLISVFNWMLIFGLFEGLRSQGSSLELARTVAIQALVAGRLVYLLSITQMGRDLVDFCRGRLQRLSWKESQAIVIGLVATIGLQLLLSQWSVLNQLFGTAPLSGQHWLICWAAAIAMLPVASLANRFHRL